MSIEMKWMEYGSGYEFQIDGVTVATVSHPSRQPPRGERWALRASYLPPVNQEGLVSVFLTLPEAKDYVEDLYKRLNETGRGVRWL